MPSARASTTRKVIALANAMYGMRGFTGAIRVESKREPRDERLKFIKADCRFVRATGPSTALCLTCRRHSYEAFSGSSARRAGPMWYRTG